MNQCRQGQGGMEVPRQGYGKEFNMAAAQDVRMGKQDVSLKRQAGPVLKVLTRQAREFGLYLDPVGYNRK